MRYQVIKPDANLADIVRFMWTLEGEASLQTPFTIRTLANGCPELIFHYRGQFHELHDDDLAEQSFLMGVHGQTDRYRRFTTREPFGIFGVYLYPYALHQLFNIPAIEFTNQLPDIHSVLPPIGHSIQEKLLTAQSDLERVRIISQFLMRRKISTRKEIVYAVTSIIHHKGDISIQDLSHECCLSQRQFERIFKTETGFTPKSFARISRFNALMSDKSLQGMPLSQIALEFGYYDQSHFTQDFKVFSGYNPATYFSGRATELV